MSKCLTRQSLTFDTGGKLAQRRGDLVNEIEPERRGSAGLQSDIDLRVQHLKKVDRGIGMV